MVEQMLQQEWAILQLDIEPGYHYIIPFQRDYERMKRDILIQTGRKPHHIQYKLPSIPLPITITNQMSMNNIADLNGVPLSLFIEVEKSNPVISKSKSKRIIKGGDMHYRVQSEKKSKDC